MSKRNIFNYNNYKEINKVTDMNNGKKAVLTKIDIKHLEDEYSHQDYLLTELDYDRKAIRKSDRYSNEDIEKYGWDKIVEYVNEDLERYETYGIDWYTLGIVAEATIMIPFKVKTSKDGKMCEAWNYKIQKISSGGIWGIGSDSDDSYIHNEECVQVEDLKSYLEVLNVDMSLYETSQNKYLIMLDTDDIAKLCEIGVIFGQLLERGKVEAFTDLEEAYKAFVEIYDDWANFVDIRNEEEKGYISAYANRVILEKYSI